MDNLIGKKISILLSPGSSGGTFLKNGICTGIVGGIGENGVFIELGGKALINVRYIIKIDIEN